MLVLGRREGESIMIPKYGIEIILIQAQDGKGRIGIVADKEVNIVRREIVDRVKQAKCVS